MNIINLKHNIILTIIYYFFNFILLIIKIQL